MDKRLIIRNFSRYAYLYDRYADIQKKISSELIEEIGEGEFKNILELGCGTGNYTRLLKERFSKANLMAVDISENMVRVACDKLRGANIDFKIADAEDMHPHGEFDLITSSSCFQWFSDLEAVLTQYRSMLRNNGIILFSIFGPFTFKELDLSLRVLLKDASTSSACFLSQRKIAEMLAKNFKKIRIRQALYTETFFCLKDLLNKIKYTGTRGISRNERYFFTPGLLSRLENIYFDRFKQIKATYQVFYCQGKHEKTSDIKVSAAAS